MSGLHVVHLILAIIMLKNKIKFKLEVLHQQFMHAMRPVSYVRPTRTKYYFH